LASQNAPQLPSTQDEQIAEWHKWCSGFTYLEKKDKDKIGNINKHEVVEFK
jgi:hypothetical protein